MDIGGFSGMKLRLLCCSIFGFLTDLVLWFWGENWLNLLNRVSSIMQWSLVRTGSSMPFFFRVCYLKIVIDVAWIRISWRLECFFKGFWLIWLLGVESVKLWYSNLIFCFSMPYFLLFLSNKVSEIRLAHDNFGIDFWSFACVSCKFLRFEMLWVEIW